MYIGKDEYVWYCIIDQNMLIYAHIQQDDIYLIVKLIILFNTQSG